MRAMPDFYGDTSPARNAWRCARAQRRVHRSTAVLNFSLVLMLFLGCEKKEEHPEAAPPPEVEVTDVVERSVPVYQEWVAQLNGENNAEITPKVQGYLLTQNYTGGFFVKKGQLLYQIDPRPFQAALEKAQADVAVADANLSKADNDVIRDTPLAKQNAIPQRQLDTDIANAASWKAQKQAQQAAMQEAELNLAWTKVLSPINGIASMSTSQIGDLVGTTTKMTTISQVDPIWAYFNISESTFLDVAPQISRIIRGGPGRRIDTPVEYIQANEELYPAKGHIVLVNRQIAAGTGTIQLAAAFPNKDATLRPGGFGRVRIRTGTNDHAMLIPQRAVVEVQSIYMVVVVSPDNKAAFRPVKVGERVGPDWVITAGLKPGEKVVVQGFMKLREGMPVTAKPYVATATGSR
jgi:membrane fusion protein (multidrug efflux system)